MSNQNPQLELGFNVSSTARPHVAEKAEAARRAKRLRNRGSWLRLEAGRVDVNETVELPGGRRIRIGDATRADLEAALADVPVPGSRRSDISSTLNQLNRKWLKGTRTVDEAVAAMRAAADQASHDALRVGIPEGGWFLLASNVVEGEDPFAR